MKNSEKNRDPVRARKRAVSDLRCAVRKLGLAVAVEHLAVMLEEQGALEAAANLRTAWPGGRRGLERAS